MRKLTCRAESAALALVPALVLLATGAAAHPYLVGDAIQPGERFNGKLEITHNCNGQPTVEVILRLPKGAASIEAPVVAGWEAHVEAAKGEIAWRGGSAPEKAEFPFGFVVPQLAAGNTVYFPVVQRCAADEVHRWVEIPAAGQDHHDVAFPAAYAVVGEELRLPEGETASDDDHQHGAHDAAEHHGTEEEHGVKQVKAGQH